MWKFTFSDVVEVSVFSARICMKPKNSGEPKLVPYESIHIVYLPNHRLIIDVTHFFRTAHSCLFIENIQNEPFINQMK